MMIILHEIMKCCNFQGNIIKSDSIHILLMLKQYFSIKYNLQNHRNGQLLQNIAFHILVIIYNSHISSSSLTHIHYPHLGSSPSNNIALFNPLSVLIWKAVLAQGWSSLIAHVSAPSCHLFLTHCSVYSLTLPDRLYLVPIEPTHLLFQVWEICLLSSFNFLFLMHQNTANSIPFTIRRFCFPIILFPFKS